MIVYEQPDPIRRSILEDESVELFKKKAASQRSLGFKGLSINLFTCPIHNNEILACISGLGHTLNMHYLIDPSIFRKMGPLDIVSLAYEDFADFVIFEREENHLVIH